MIDLNTWLGIFVNDFILGYFGSFAFAGLFVVLGLLWFMFKHQIPATGLIVLAFPLVLLLAKYGFISHAWGGVALILGGVITTIAFVRLVQER